MSNITVQECTPAEYADELARLSKQLEIPVSFPQAPYYGAWQQRDGKDVVFFAAHDGMPVVAAGLAVRYTAPGGISFWYCPYGPVAAEWTPALYEALRAFFAPIALRSGAAFVRLDSDGLVGSADGTNAGVPGVRPVPNRLAKTASLQPRAEWLLDISGDQEAVWMGLHQHARYNVRLAERANARIKFYESAKAPLDTFFDLMQTTAGRGSFGIQSHRYYEAVLQSIPADNGFVAVCTIDGKPAAAAIFAAYDGVLHYVFAGSSDEFRKIAPPYFIIWNAILEARKRGLHALNFGGITDAVKGHHLAGVTAFKKRFGGYEVTHPNPVDLVYKPLKYALFSAYKTVKR